MFIISVETHFRASHQLTLPDGSKEPLHKHNWSVISDVYSDKLDNTGIVIDFRQLKMILDNIVSNFNNISLDKIRYFQQNIQSAENVAKFIYEKLETKLPKNVNLKQIKVVEKAGCSAKFCK